MKKIIVLFLLIIFLPILCFAHGGRTDSKGGHYDKSTGIYHYHHGYPAHQHIDGVCPYDFDDKTGQNSGSSSKKVKTTAKPTYTPAPKKETKSNSSNSPSWVLPVGIGGGAYLIGKSVGKKKRK